MAEAKDWRGLIPLRVTSEDVVNALGISPTHSVYNYVLDGLKVSFHYQYQSGEKTCQGKTRYYKIPAMTVVSIDITPTHYVSLRELSINLQSFQLIPRTFHGKPESGFYLLDKQLGMALTLNDDHSVDTITYLPSLSDEEHFSCQEPPATQEISPVEEKLQLSSILYSKFPNLEQRLLSKDIEDLMEVFDELVLPLEHEMLGYRLKHVLPDSDYLAILDATLKFPLRHTWSPLAPIDLLDWAKICFVIQTLMLDELAIPLSKHLAIDDPVVQLRLLETLRILGEKNALYEIVFLLEEESLDPDVVEAALDTLVAFKAEEAIPFLEEHLDSRGAYTPHQALKALIQIGGANTVSGLLKGLSLVDHGSRKLAIQGLTAVGGPSAIESLLEGLNLEDRYADVRREAVKGLIRLQATEHYPKFWKAIGNQKDPDLRSPAFAALMAIGDDRATAVFFKKLQMRNPPI